MTFAAEQEAEFELPPARKGRDYSEEPSPPPDALLLPVAPRERSLVNSFKKAIIQHVEDRGDKTTEDFLEDLAVDLWRLTRRK